MVNFFGALKGIGSFTEKDKFKGQFEEWSIYWVNFKEAIFIN